MEKIVKLEEFNWVSGRDAVTIALCNTIIGKQNEIIDYLNSQDQEEENTVCEGCGKTITSRFMQSYTKGDGMHSYCLSCDPEKQDTPEEWEKELRKRWYLWTYNKELDQYITCENEVIDFIQAELDKAREEVIKNLIKKIEEANCDSISLEFLREIDLSKLTNK